MEQDCEKGAGRERFKNIGSSGLDCGGQDNLDEESLAPNSPLEECINDDDKPITSGNF